jgi:methylmalonyl-CoA mutase N-terminal domain/subunit
MLENVPGSFPFTAGVFAFKRENEDPTRMFAGEGDAFRTNRASTCCRRACRPSACPPRSTR